MPSDPPKWSNPPTRVESTEDLLLLVGEPKPKTMADVKTLADLEEVLGPCPQSALAGPGVEARMEREYQDLSRTLSLMDPQDPEWDDIIARTDVLWNSMSEESRREVTVAIQWEQVGEVMASLLHSGFGSQDGYGNSVHRVGDEASGFQYEIRSVGRPTELTDDENEAVYEYLDRHVTAMWEATEDSNKRGPASFRWKKRG